MKQFWIGIGILAALLLGGIWLGNGTEDIHSQQARDLEKAAAAAAEGNWSLAAALSTRAEKDWTARKGMNASVYRHDPVELIDAGFAALKGYASCQDAAAFSGTCTQLAQQIRGLPEVHRFRWRNLL